MIRIYTAEINGMDTKYYTTFDKALASFAAKVKRELHGMDIEQNQKAQYLLNSNDLFGGNMRLAHIGWIDAE